MLHCVSAHNKNKYFLMEWILSIWYRNNFISLYCLVSIIYFAGTKLFREASHIYHNLEKIIQYLIKMPISGLCVWNSTGRNRTNCLRHLLTIDMLKAIEISIWILKIASYA